MQLSYGPYVFQANSTLITFSVENLWNTGEQIYAQRRRVHVKGFLLANGQDAISAADVALAQALGNPYGDFLFRGDDGSVMEDCSLRNARSISGVKVTMAPAYPETMGPEFATQRTFSIEAEAEYVAANGANLMLSFNETLAFAGGLPIYAFRKSLNGPPQKQLLYPFDSYRVTQHGSAVGYGRYPAPPDPIWPAALLHAGDIQPGSPRRRGRGYSDYPISWRYEFESDTPLIGRPNLWLS